MGPVVLASRSNPQVLSVNVDASNLSRRYTQVGGWRFWQVGCLVGCTLPMTQGGIRSCTAEFYTSDVQYKPVNYKAEGVLCCCQVH